MIRRAQVKDIDDLVRLLYQVNEVHACKRPDVFKRGARKYTDEELKVIIADDDRPVYVYADENGVVKGYAFCIYEYTEETTNVNAMKSLYIDDLCVDENERGKHIGTKLYEYVLKVAEENECYRVTLNVWELNESAYKFYQKCGLKPLKTTLEHLI